MKKYNRHIVHVQTVLLILLMLATSGIVCAKVWSAEDVPMVHLQDRNRYVSDPEHLMSAAVRDSSDYYLKRLHLECGVQPVFVVVGKVKNADCFRMAQDLGNRYGVGTKKERRGLVIVIAVDDRRYFIAPGKGLEGDLTDIECDDIARACIVRNMRVNDIDMAVLHTSKAIFNKLKTGKMGIEQVDRADKEADDDMTILFLVIICILVPVLMQYVGRKNNGRNQGPRRRRNDDDDWIPPFIFGGGGGFGSGGSIGGSFGGGSFGGGGAGGGW